ncbi:hypothetical protein QVD17_25968 [Tagetes erecta]|uniref:30S ribosomal protein S17, chloroplastic n=1 Tax=Tagetes erecta TaxID=13708 RepID=A0AAD8NQD4_TARER|nr:hypothetical protein QVD17_25968 [Tagetes erecta]
MSLLHLQLPLRQLKSLNLSSSFLHGTSTIRNPSATAVSAPNHRYLPPIRAMRSLQGRVICTTNDKTVNVEVVRLAPHPKYKRRVRKKNKFQAHDPENQFEIGDIVQLEKCKPISKKKTFLAVPVPKRTVSKQLKDVESNSSSSSQPLINLIDMAGVEINRHSRVDHLSTIDEFLELYKLATCFKHGMFQTLKLYLLLFIQHSIKSVRFNSNTQRFVHVSKSSQFISQFLHLQYKCLSNQSDSIRIHNDSFTFLNQGF